MILSVHAAASDENKTTQNNKQTKFEKIIVWQKRLILAENRK